MAFFTISTSQSGLINFASCPKESSQPVTSGSEEALKVNLILSFPFLAICCLGLQTLSSTYRAAQPVNSTTTSKTSSLMIPNWRLKISWLFALLGGGPQYIVESS
jgi:hypothetical protein